MDVIARLERAHAVLQGVPPAIEDEDLSEGVAVAMSLIENVARHLKDSKEEAAA